MIAASPVTVRAPLDTVSTGVPPLAFRVLPFISSVTFASVSRAKAASTVAASAPSPCANFTSLKEVSPFLMASFSASIESEPLYSYRLPLLSSKAGLNSQSLHMPDSS